MNSSDSEYEEEEIIVFADFKNNVIFDEADKINSSIKIIGIDSDNPIADLNGNIFKGTYDFSMGTHVFFEENLKPPPVDPVYEKYAKKPYKYFNKTNKVLNFTRIFLEPENTTSSENLSQETESESENDATNPLLVNIKYEEAIKQFQPDEN